MKNQIGLSALCLIALTVVVVVRSKALQIERGPGGVRAHRRDRLRNGAPQCVLPVRSQRSARTVRRQLRIPGHSGPDAKADHLDSASEHGWLSRSPAGRDRAQLRAFDGSSRA